MLPYCCNLNFGLATKAKGLQGWRPRGSSRVKAKRSQGYEPKKNPGVTSHTPGNVKKCEGLWRSEPSHSQGNSHFGRWSPNGLSKLQRAISGGQNSMARGVLYMIGKLLECRCLKWAHIVHLDI
jgi:hypothetical protein